jgi:hypothetical protein
LPEKLRSSLWLPTSATAAARVRELRRSRLSAGDYVLWPPLLSSYLLRARQALLQRRRWMLS